MVSDAFVGTAVDGAFVVDQPSSFSGIFGHVAFVAFDVVEFAAVGYTFAVELELLVIVAVLVAASTDLLVEDLQAPCLAVGFVVFAAAAIDFDADLAAVYLAGVYVVACPDSFAVDSKATHLVAAVAVSVA